MQTDLPPRWTRYELEEILEFLDRLHPNDVGPIPASIAKLADVIEMAMD